MQTARWWLVVLVGLIGSSVLVSAQRAQQDPKPKPKPMPVSVVKSKTVDPDRDPETDRWLSQFLASPRLAAVREAERIEMLPVDTLDEKMSVWKFIDPPVTLDAATMQQVRGMVTNPRSYNGGPMVCIFSPGLALRFYKGKSKVQMLVCFMCHEVMFENAAGRVIGSKIHFEPKDFPLLAVARRQFPDRFQFPDMP